MTARTSLTTLIRLYQSFGTEPFTSADAISLGIPSVAPTLSGLRQEGLIRSLTSSRQDDGGQSRTLWAITPGGVAKARRRGGDRP
jgi:DNA-binding PadR family transcriptional regulator